MNMFDGSFLSPTQKQDDDMDTYDVEGEGIEVALTLTLNICTATYMTLYLCLPACLLASIPLSLCCFLALARIKSMPLTPNPYHVHHKEHAEDGKTVLVRRQHS